jgi:hypothetical protein
MAMGIMVASIKGLIMIAFRKWGVQRGKAPLLGVWGYPPTLKFPQDWGIKGVEKRLINNLS